MKIAWMIALSILGMLNGCTQQSTPSIFESHAGIYISTTNSQAVIGVIQVVPRGDTAAIFGYTVAKEEDARAIAANGFPYVDRAGIITGTIRGTITTTSSSTSVLTCTLQINPNGEAWITPATIATASFDTSGNLTIAAPSGSSATSDWQLYAKSN